MTGPLPAACNHYKQNSGDCKVIFSFVWHNNVARYLAIWTICHSEPLAKTWNICVWLTLARSPCDSTVLRFFFNNVHSQNWEWKKIKWKNSPIPIKIKIRNKRNAIFIFGRASMWFELNMNYFRIHNDRTNLWANCVKLLDSNYLSIVRLMGWGPPIIL